ncbi:MAG TPA: hypothetical protein VNR60_00880 [Croceibacterium sp.]|nr:hypothetical protein [Croceibacterium sp.]
MDRTSRVDALKCRDICAASNTEGQYMVIRKALIALASAGLVLSSTAAVAAPAARSASSVDGAEAIGGGSWAWILALVVLAGVIGVIASDSDEEIPTSP